VKEYGGPTELRCFAPDECRQYGQPLLQIINGELSGPAVRLTDLSKSYPTGSVRPLQFELWFGPGPIPLANAKQSAY